MSTNAIDIALTVGAVSAALLAGLAAAVLITLGYRAGTAIAIRWHGRQLADWAEAFANHPAHRTRKEDRP